MIIETADKIINKQVKSVMLDFFKRFGQLVELALYKLC